MTVLIIPSWYKAGGGAQLGAFFREQALALHAQGVNVIVADATLQGRQGSFSKNNYKLQKFNDEGLLTYAYLTPSFGLLRFPKWGVRAYASNLKKIFKRIIKDGIKIDVIHAHSFYPAGVVATRLAKQYDIPIVVTEHASGVVSNQLNKSKKQYLQETVENADSFICVGERLKTCVEQITGTDKKILVIPNMVNKHFSWKESVKSDEFRFISIGNLIKRKRFDLTLSAFADAFGGKTAVKLTVVGDGVLREELHKKAKNLGIENQVFFTGRLNRNDVVKELQKSHVFVLPSDYETFGVVYIEAMACGLPIIATKNGGGEDIVKKEFGELVDTNSVEQLKEAMWFIYTNYEKYNHKEIAEYCQSEYGDTSIAHKLITVYQELV